MHDRMGQNYPEFDLLKEDDRTELERTIDEFPLGNSRSRNEWTHDAKLALRAGKGLPNLKGDKHDFTTHYVYSRALEEGGHNLSPEQTEALGKDLSDRMNTTIRLAAQQNALEPMGFGFRKKGSDDDFILGVAYCRQMSKDKSIFILTDPSLAEGPAYRRVLTDEELYDRYEVNEDWS